MKTEKRDQILEAALVLFAEFGFRGTSTAQIAKQAGVATGTLFHHFATKEDLINEVYQGVKFELADSLTASLSENHLVRDHIRAIWFGFVQWSLDNQQKYRFIKHCEASPHISESLRRKCEEKFTPIFEVFQQAADAGVIKGLPVDFVLQVTNGLIDGFIRYLMLHPEKVSDEGVWEQAFNLCWDAIR